MKIIISAGNRKRFIEAPFSVCGCAEDLRLLRDELTRVLDSNNRDFTYGWIDIIPNRPLVLANTPPDPWDA